MKPHTAYGRRKKGNQGEREAKAILERHGYLVLNGAMAEPGCDLILEPKGAVEVKNRSWASIGGVERSYLLVAAEALRRKGVAHWCLFREADGWFLCSIGRKADGRIGLLLKRPIKAPPSQLSSQAPGREDALGLFAESGAAQRLTVAGETSAHETAEAEGRKATSKPLGEHTKTGTRQEIASAPPAKPIGQTEGASTTIAVPTWAASIERRPPPWGPDPDPNGGD